MVGNQHSLNEYTLNYIYQTLLNKNIDNRKKDFLDLVDMYRDEFCNEQYLDRKIKNPNGFLQLILELIGLEISDVK